MISEKKPPQTQSVTDWRNRVKSIAQQRRRRFPSSFIRLSFYYRRLCLANGYVSGMFEEEEDPLSITNEEEEEEDDNCDYPESDDEVFGPNPTVAPVSMRSLVLTYKCQGRSMFPDMNLTMLYAMVGLHRYNMLNGTNLDLYDLKKVTSKGFTFSTYFITLVAYNPTIDGFERISDSQKTTFQVRVDELKLVGLSLTCSIARPLGQGSPEEESLIRRDFYKETLPGWPSNSDVDDSKRFYVVKREEWLYTNDWIYFYLHLVVFAKYRWLTNSHLFKVEIVEVAIETHEQEVEPLNAKNANVFIKNKDWDKADCKAVVRRVIDKRTGWLSLVGDFSGGRPLTSEEQFVANMCGIKVYEQPSITPQW